MMKKNSILAMLMVLIAALFGSSFVACSNGISDDPETELEKYYDIAPNSFLKEFAGISYLTKETNEI